jgi:hypothetical protein
MSRFCLQIASVAVVTVSLMAFPGCGSSSPANKPAGTPAAGHYEGDGHDHRQESGDHKGHDHEKAGAHK